MCNIIYIYHLQAIYKDVNSKAYLLRLSSFFNLYLHSFGFVWFFFLIFTEFLYAGFSLPFNKHRLPLLFQEQVMFHSNKFLSDSSEIFCHC
uniref:Uncharacterized protein n=1 Tax=Coturnix japonica TaxID=93934 RepID=A0A8C2YGQ6_COTJA